ncbi:MAG: hypothetical protein V3S54_03350 [Woeseiaceae bacterium]
MPHREPPKPPPIEVDDVGRNRVPFLRSLEWIATALRTFREKPLPSTYFTDVQPVFDLFGSARSSEMQFATFGSLLGGIELAHARVAAGRVRQYLSMEYSHDDLVNHVLRPGRVIDTATGFPFAAMRDGISVSDVEPLSIRNFTIGPGSRAAVQADAMGAGARLTLSLVWIEVPLGEYLQSIQ